MTKAEEAQRLVDERVVDVSDFGPPNVIAKVLGDRGLYGIILWGNGRYHCSCPWRCLHPLADEWCAHALAVKLAVEKEKSDVEATGA